LISSNLRRVARLLAVMCAASLPAAVWAQRGPGLPAGAPAAPAASSDSLAGRTGKPGRSDIFFCTSPDLGCRTSINTFDADETRDLFIFTAWPRLRGVHTLELRIYLPDGNLYQILRAEFSTTANAVPAGGQLARLSRGEPTVVIPLAIAGTAITQRSLLGVWSVEAVLDGVVANRTPLHLRRRQRN
jgi:hypothetical protein